MLGVSYDLMEGLSMEEAVPALQMVFAKEQIGEFTTVLYDADHFDDIENHLQLDGGLKPQTVAIDRDGNVVDTQSGGADRDRFVEMMRKALGTN